jgi:hypothetical protein
MQSRCFNGGDHENTSKVVGGRRGARYCRIRGDARRNFGTGGRDDPAGWVKREQRVLEHIERAAVTSRSAGEPDYFRTVTEVLSLESCSSVLAVNS